MILATDLKLAPCLTSPQTTTEPSSFKAAKAALVAVSFRTALVSWSCTKLPGFPPLKGSPQQTTDPSFVRAAKELLVAATSTTLRRAFRTELLSPPEAASPQVTTCPELLITANASSVEAICFTSFCKASQTCVLSPPESGSPQVNRDPSERNAAKAYGLEWIDETFAALISVSSSQIDLQSPPQSASPQQTIRPSVFNAAKATLFEKICCTSNSRCFTESESWHWRKRCKINVPRA